jgi:hypothetical protein
VIIGGQIPSNIVYTCEIVIVQSPSRGVCVVIEADSKCGYTRIGLTRIGITLFFFNFCDFYNKL